ncbi:hypothetical protein Taro_015851 [Colocasia esculenta]|uniref:ditrans,polycis-polyprenyl diphosphate synthase [(2E,6E)-farnesyldiphosphate specific] n=1 Tax=Colocasia esculenta TaxID=4460 RepID=A0A843UNG3_COLES|nr:hypothetical protein [Colocasia esculenta]
MRILSVDSPMSENWIARGPRVLCVLKRSEAGLRKWTCSSTRHCVGFLPFASFTTSDVFYLDGPNVIFINVQECDIHTLSPFVDPEKMTLEVLSSYDGKEAVVNAANFLCSKHLKENNVVGDQRELVFTEADMADALTTVGCGGPEPGLLLVFSPVRCHWGFPAWRMRYTEIVHMGSLKYMKYGAVIKAIYDLSRKHQNFGMFSTVSWIFIIFLPMEPFDHSEKVKFLLSIRTASLDVHRP